MKWFPATVTSVWLGQVRQNWRWVPVRMAPGSAFTNNFGNGADAMNSAYAEAIDTTSAGSPAIGISRGQVRVGPHLLVAWLAVFVFLEDAVLVAKSSSMWVDGLAVGLLEELKGTDRR